MFNEVLTVSQFSAPTKNKTVITTMGISIKRNCALDHVFTAGHSVPPHAHTMSKISPTTGIQVRRILPNQPKLDGVFSYITVLSFL